MGIKIDTGIVEEALRLDQLCLRAINSFGILMTGLSYAAHKTAPDDSPGSDIAEFGLKSCSKGFAILGRMDNVGTVI